MIKLRISYTDDSEIERFLAFLAPLIYKTGRPVVNRGGSTKRIYVLLHAPGD